MENFSTSSESRLGPSKVHKTACMSDGRSTHGTASDSPITGVLEHSYMYIYSYIASRKLLATLCKAP